MKHKRKGANPADYADNWWGGSVRSLAKLTQTEDIYSSVYGTQSELVHTSSRSMNEYVIQTEGEWLARCYPDSNHPDLPATVRWASSFFLGILKHVNDAWHLPLDGDIESTLSEIEKLN